MSTFYMDYENGLDANTGADWANAWKTLTAGPTAARIAPGDEIRIAKSPDPVSIGNATWNDLSKTVTLAAALTLLVDDCEADWTAANASTVTHPTTAMKSGAANVQITKAAYATDTLYAYKALAAPTDFSDYTGLSLWVRNDAAIADAVRWKVCLCSDAAGAVIVDTFWIPAIPSTNRWVALSLEKDGGGALGNAIASIAVYSGTSAPTNGQDILLDNVNACDYGGFSIQSLISKNSLATGGTEGWYGIQSISGVTLLLDNDTETIASAGRGYSGTTETVTTYRRETIKTALAAAASTAVQAVQDSGTEAGGDITFSGGWNTSNTTQDGETIFDGLSGNGYGLQLSGKSLITASRLGFVRYNRGLDMLAAANINTISCSVLGNCSNGMFCLDSFRNTLAATWVNNNLNAGVNLTASSVGFATATVTLGQVNNNGVTSPGVDLFTAANDNTITISKCNNNAVYGVHFRRSYGNRVTLTECKDNGTAQVAHTLAANTLRNSTLTGTEFAATVDYTDGRLYSHNHDGTAYHRIFTDGGQIDSLATDFAAPASGSMWKLLTSATTRTSNYPLWLELPGIAVVANKLVTIKAMMKKAHATQVNGRLVVRGGQIAGVDDDVVATLADSTAEQELTITFTPTEAGVVVPEVWAEYVSGHAAVYIDRFTRISQAA